MIFSRELTSQKYQHLQLLKFEDDQHKGRGMD